MMMNHPAAIPELLPCRTNVHYHTEFLRAKKRRVLDAGSYTITDKCATEERVSDQNSCAIFVKFAARPFSSNTE
jgi:hypothetical protein